MTTLNDHLASLPLIDHHCHGLAARDLSDDEFAGYAGESDWPAPPGTSALDSPFGLAVRALCAPLLGLPAHAPMAEYLSARRDLGAETVNRRLLAAAGIDHFLVDTGHRSSELTSPDNLADLADDHARADEIVRLESVAESVLGTLGNAADFAKAFGTELDHRLRSAVGVKSIIAYREGLNVDGIRPTPTEVTSAAGRVLAGRDADGMIRLAEPVLLRQLIWAAVDRAAAIQFHAGIGDSDVTLHDADPSRLSGFLRATVDSGARVLLLHNWPFITHAGYLAHVYPHVYFDVGLAVGLTGGAPSVIEQALELAPYGKIVFSTDAYALPELYYCGAELWRRGLSAALDRRRAAGLLGDADAIRIASQIGRDNAVRAYELSEPA